MQLLKSNNSLMHRHPVKKSHLLAVSIGTYRNISMPFTFCKVYFPEKAICSNFSNISQVYIFCVNWNRI